eukprot:1225631-Rhodomonas_salina.2
MHSGARTTYIGGTDLVTAVVPAQIQTQPEPKRARGGARRSGGGNNAVYVEDVPGSMSVESRMAPQASTPLAACSVSKSQQRLNALVFRLVMARRDRKARAAVLSRVSAQPMSGWAPTGRKPAIGRTIG